MNRDRARARVTSTYTILVALALALSTTAFADDDFAGGTIIFARGGSLYRADPKGKNETELAKLPDKAAVRALRTDALAKVLLVDLAGTWSYLPLDPTAPPSGGAAGGAQVPAGEGSKPTLVPLPCADGPAQLAEDGACVFCRAAKGGSQIVNLATGKVFPIQVPAPGTRLAGVGAGRKLVWADTGGVWTAPPGNPKQATRVAPDAPKRGFLPSPDGSRAVGTYPDEIYTDAHHKQAADVLMGFALDGEGARRKGIKNGVPVEWSHDNTWVLVQDGAKACLMRATGGEYKCWRGYTAASIAPDGKFALVLGNRDGSKKQTPPKKAAKGAKKDAKKPPPPPPADEPTESDETDADDGAAPADVDVPPPTGPLALYRVRLEGSPYTEPPALVTKVIDGAAVWVPMKP